MVKESTFQDKVKGILSERKAYFEVIWGGGFQASGIPDILACYKGVYIGLELKVGYNKPSAIQLAKIDMIRSSGGVGAIIWDNLEPVIDILDSIDRGNISSVASKYTVRKDSHG